MYVYCLGIRTLCRELILKLQGMPNLFIPHPRLNLTTVGGLTRLDTLLGKEKKQRLNYDRSLDLFSVYFMSLNSLEVELVECAHARRS